MNEVATNPEKASENDYPNVYCGEISTLLALYIHARVLDSLLVIQGRIKFVEYVTAYRRRRHLFRIRNLVRGEHSERVERGVDFPVPRWPYSFAASSRTHM